MIKKLACVSVLATALLASAPVAQAAPAASAPVPVPGPASGAPLVPFLSGVLGSLEVGHPATSAQSLLPTGILGG
ncbi:hypothetical protein ACFYP4_16260 [Streptomyces sp. NPDC005551]|uniref:hypothetical protein n=1 Tax=unclassified Streptomyces TaxID=2593676 RepID=UPI0033CA62C1